MDNSEMINQNSACGESSKEVDGTVHVDHPIHQKLDVDSIYDDNPSATDSFDVPPSTKEEIMATGYPSKENIFVGHGFVGSFYPEFGVAKWVFECLTLNQINAIHKNKNFPRGVFFEDQTIDFERIVTLMDYQGTKYQRGHLAAAGNHKYNSLAYYSSFWYGNTAPMGQGVNFILSNIEEQGRKLAREYEKLYIITGSVFDPESETKFMKAGSLVRVPDAYYKVFIYLDKHKGCEIYRVCGYLIDNESDKSEKIIKISKDIAYAREHLECINRITGLNILSVTNRKQIFEVPLPYKGQSRCIFNDLFPDQRTHRGIGS